MQHALIHWKNNTPFSTTFDDIYFNPTQGRAESDYVFLQHNDLTARFAHVQQFVIGELGFGTGLNFLHTAQQFLKLAPPEAQLDFMSIEAYPLSKEAIQQALYCYPGISTLCNELISQYPPALPGFHRLILGNGRIRLTLLFGQVESMLPQWVGRVDAWYLDGFAPNKNPDMWSLTVMQQLARLSHHETSFSTFTAARLVQNNLTTAGFSVQKTKGFGRKREMLFGIFKGKASSHNIAPWCGLDHNTPAQQVFIIGAGLAGCTTAYCLAQRGIGVTLLEASPDIAQGASGNPVGLLRPHFSPNHDVFDQFYTAGFYGTKRLIRALIQDASIPHQFSGLLQLLTNTRLQKKYQLIDEKRVISDAQLQIASANTIHDTFGLNTSHNGVFFPEAGVVCPRSLCQALIAHPKITVHTGQAVQTCRHDGSRWQINTAQNQSFTASHLVIASASDSTSLSLCAEYPITQSTGQLTLIPEQEHLPVCSLSYDGYVTPALHGWHALGASFRPHGAARTVDPQEQQENLAKLAEVLPNLANAIDLTQCQARVGVRAVTPDHLPLVGPIDDKALFSKRFLKFAKGYQRHVPTPQPLPNAYLCSGFGAKGLASCWLSGETLASIIAGTPLPISNALYKALYPARFWLRQLQKFSYTPASFKI